MSGSPEPDMLTQRVMNIAKELRQTRNLTADMLATRMTESGYPISREVIANYENGRRALITVTEAAGFAKVFNIDLTWLITGEGVMCLICRDHIWGDLTCNNCGHSGPDKPPAWEALG